LYFDVVQEWHRSAFCKQLDALKSAHGNNANVPMALLETLDSGKHPQQFLSEKMDELHSMNQSARGQMHSLRRLLDSVSKIESS